MKKITLLLFLVSASFGFAQNGGDTCGTAVVATPGTYTGTLITQGTAGGVQGTTQPRDAAWFSYTPATSGTIDVSSCLGGADSRVYIATGTCGALTTVASNDDTCAFAIDGTGNAYAAEITGFPVTGGVTYYIEWDDRWSTAAFNWTLTFNAPPVCESPSVIFADVLTDISLDFSWDVPVFGTPVSYEWEVVADGAGQGNSIVVSGTTTAPATNDATGAVLTASTPYDFYIRTNCGVDGFGDWVGPLNFTTLSGPPPSNDNCGGATSIVQETSIATVDLATSTAGTIENSSNSGLAAEPCAGFTGAANDDVWYSFEALTADVNVTVEVTGTAFDVVIQLYSGTCGALVVESCADATVTTPPVVEQVSATGLTVGETYYFRVYQFSTLETTGKTFNVKVWSPETLSVDSFDNNAFTYFPNPVKNTLQLNAQSNIQNVSIYNMLGQEVLRTAPNTVNSTIEMSALQTGAYFVKVTINDRTETVRVIKQ
uniref:T9SS type A sorting domain-containing protein n=1 Tax=Gelidibacter sp. TaxID=2018083 RepID=UPI0040492FF5